VARKLKSDNVLFMTIILLVGVSVVMVYSASTVMAMERYHQPYLFLTKQLMWAVLGVALMWMVMRIDYRIYRQRPFIWTALALVLLCLIAVLFSPAVNGAKRWFGVMGLGIQPSELAKVIGIIFIAEALDRRMHRIDDVTYSILPIAVVVVPLVGLVLVEPDFGTSMSLAIVAAVMIFTAGLNWRYITGAFLCALPALYIVTMGTAYRRRRMLTFLNPWENPLGDGFQIIQSLIAVGTGGITGRGLMNGVQKLFYLPEPHTDFIYSVVAEETGVIGATFLLLCFLVITWRGLRAALRAPDSFGAFLAIGLTTMVAVQALVNISVVLGLMPTKGIPLPFISFGGSSLLISLLAMGILLNVSQHAAPEA
jgi:cell division protein FtsW